MSSFGIHLRAIWQEMLMISDTEMYLKLLPKISHIFQGAMS